MKTTHAVWERENIGVDAWEIALDAQDTIEALAEEERHIIAEGAEYIVLKSPVNCPQLLFGLTGLGYTFVETVFHVEIRRKDYHMPETIARFDRGLTVVERTDPENQARIDRIIRSGIFISDRVSIDPAFSVKLGGQRYANWLRSMVQKGGHLYEVLQGEKPIGFFVICRKAERPGAGRASAQKDAGHLLHPSVQAADQHHCLQQFQGASGLCQRGRDHCRYAVYVCQARRALTRAGA